MAAMSSPPSLDPGEAGQVWRRQALENFEEKLKALGIDESAVGGEFAALRDQIASLTAELDELYVRQESVEDKDAVKEWWHDGEYDAGRADAWNDEGLAACKEGRGIGTGVWSSSSSYGRAYECFTEAIRLHPQSAVYHCNRALAGLKLGRYDLALEDARNAISRREGYVSAYVRAGKACLGLGDGREAKEYFDAALKLDGGCKAAVKGKQEAARAEAERGAQEAANVARGNACLRPRLPSTADEMRSRGVQEEAAVRLIAAEEMLSSVGPGKYYTVASAMYEKAECLILLGRYVHATEFMEMMKKTGATGGEQVAETRYLRAEAAWRRGDLESALVYLKGMGAVRKCHDVEQMIRRHFDAMKKIQALLDDGMNSEAISRCDELVAQDGIAASVCGGLLVRILRLRAKGYCQKQQWADAQRDLEACLEIDAEDVEAIRERADVLRERGLYTEYFLSLQELKRIFPQMSGLAALIENAARLASSEGRARWDAGAGHNGHDGLGSSGESKSSILASGSISSFEILGIARGATLGDVRRAYLRLAARWHPDKWVGKPEADVMVAEAKFKSIKDAYEDLMRGI